MRYKILTRGLNDGTKQQFTSYIGNFADLDTALEGARCLANGRNISLAHYSIVDANDASNVVVREITPGPAAYHPSMG